MKRERTRKLSASQTAGYGAVSKRNDRHFVEGPVCKAGALGRPGLRTTDWAAAARRVAALLVCMVFLTLAALPAFGQAFGSISGNVTDPTGAVVPGARVTATETQTGFSRTVTSDKSGHYVIPNLRPTQYSLTVEAKGFKRAIRSSITLEANQSATVDIRLELGSAVQSVTVTGGAPLVNTTTQTLNSVVGRERMMELPLNGRHALQLLNLVPGVSGVSMATVTSQGTLPGSGRTNINGSRNNETSYSLDGANFLDQYYNTNIPFPFPDALQEFSVQTNNYSARYGGNAGGVVNVVTKSGSNKYHGDLFEFVRNPVFNARPWDANNRDFIKRNQFGGTLGGPVVIPHLYNGHNRTFFFVGFQAERYRDSSTSHTYVPTLAEQNGDFSALLSASNPDNPFGKAELITNPWSYTVGTTAPGQPFPGNVIPTSALDPASLNLAKNYLPQVGGTGLVYYGRPTIQNVNSVILRIDQKLGSKDTLTGRWFKDHVVLVPQNPAGNLLGYAAGYDQPMNNMMIQETHTFKPNMLNQASFTFSDVPTEKTFAGNSPNVATFGVTGLWLPTDKWIQNIHVNNGGFAINGGAKGPFNNKDYGFQDNLSWVIGRHNLDIGASFDHSSVVLGDQYLAQGQFTFDATNTNNSLASFMLGYLHNFHQGYGEFKNNRNNFWAFYFNDSFHATRRLTLNYGLRYEPYFPWKELQGRAEVFSPANYYAGVQSQKFVNAPPGLLFPGDKGVPFAGVRGNFTDFSPRVGFAYDLTGNGTTSIRGGAGYFYDSQTAGVINNRFADISPFSPQVSLTPAPGPFSEPLRGYTGYYPFPFTYPPASDTPFSLPDLVITYDPSTKYLVPLTYQWDLAVERQLGTNSMLQVAYVGSHAIHQKETIQLNPCPVNATQTCNDSLRLFAPYYGVVAMDGQDVNSNFNALEVTFKRRVSKNFNVDVAYTYSKALSNIPNGGNNNDINSDSSSPIPWYSPGRHQFDYGPSGFDHTHRLVVSYVWMLPSLSGSNWLERGVLGDWEWSGIVTAQSGGPFTILAGKDQSGTGLGQDRGVQLAGVPAFASNQFGACGASGGAYCVNYLNKSAFAEPARGTFGTLAKDSFRGPGYFDWDMSVDKNFQITERYRLQFRADFFNAFNTVNFNNPTANVSSGGFGTITGAGSPRIGQLALKLFF